MFYFSEDGSEVQVEYISTTKTLSAQELDATADDILFHEVNQFSFDISFSEADVRCTEYGNIPISSITDGNKFRFKFTDLFFSEFDIGTESEGVNGIIRESRDVQSLRSDRTGRTQNGNMFFILHEIPQGLAKEDRERISSEVRNKIDRRCNGDDGVKSVKHAAVSGENKTKVFDFLFSLDIGCNKISELRNDGNNDSEKDHRDIIYLNVANDLNDKSVKHVSDDATKNTSEGAFNGFLGADLGNQFVLAEQNADKICAGIGHPCADEYQAVQVYAGIALSAEQGNAHNAEHNVESPCDQFCSLQKFDLSHGKHGEATDKKNISKRNGNDHDGDLFRGKNAVRENTVFCVDEIGGNGRRNENSV